MGVLTWCRSRKRLTTVNDPKRQYSTVLMRAPFSGDGHTIVANRMVRDRQLSFKARGILTYLGSHVEGWETSEERLAEESTDKLHAVRTGLAELEEDGYMLRFREILANGTRAGALWIFSDNPDTLPGHAQAILDQLAAEGRRFVPLNKRTRESMKRRRPAPQDVAEGAPGPGWENPILEPGEQNPSSEPTSENRILGPTSDFPSLENPMHKNTTSEGEGEDRDARAHASNDPSPGDTPEPGAGLRGQRRYRGVSLASRDLVADIVRAVLTEREGISDDEWTEFAARADMMRSAVESSPVSWEEYEAWLRQGWVHPDGRPAFKDFSKTLRWRLSPDRLRAEAWVWVLEQRAAKEDSGPHGGREAPRSELSDGRPELNGVCGVHKTTYTSDGKCLRCEAENAEPDAAVPPLPEDVFDNDGQELEEISPDEFAAMSAASLENPKASRAELLAAARAKMAEGSERAKAGKGGR